MRHTNNKGKQVYQLVVISSGLLISSALILVFPGLLSALAALETVEKFAILCFLSLSLVVLNREKIIAVLTASRMSQLSNPAHNDLCAGRHSAPKDSYAGQSYWKPFQYKMTCSAFDTRINHQKARINRADTVLVENEIW